MAQRFGAYVLQEKIAADHVFETWRATDDAQGLPVVIKRVHSALMSDLKFLTALLSDATAASQVRSEHLVRIIGADVVDGSAFVAYEHAEGVALEKLLARALARNATVPAEVALAVADALCAALEGVHSGLDAKGAWLQLVHREVTPSNVLVSDTGQVMLAGLGLARAYDEESQAAKSSFTKTRSAYCAPEHTLGTAPDARSDLYSLGVVLFEMLSGRLPQRNVLQPHAEPLSAAWPNAPAPLERLLKRLLATDPDERFGTAFELQTALRGQGALADPLSIGRWASVMTDRAASASSDGPFELPPYVSDKALDEAGLVQAPTKLVTAADFDAPIGETLSLSREVVARSSVAQPTRDDRPRIILTPKEPTAPAAPLPSRIELPPERRPGGAPRAPEVLPVLAGKSVEPSKGLPVAWLIAGLVVFAAIGAVAWRATRPASAAMLVVPPRPPEPVAVEAKASGDAGDADLDPETGMRRTLHPVEMGDADHLSRDHSELEPVRYMIDSVPSGAVVTINGEVVGETPWGGDVDPVRPVTLTLTKKGYRAFSAEVDAGIDYNATVRLKR